MAGSRERPSQGFGTAWLLAIYLQALGCPCCYDHGRVKSVRNGGRRPFDASSAEPVPVI